MPLQIQYLSVHWIASSVGSIGGGGNRSFSFLTIPCFNWFLKLETPSFEDSKSETPSFEDSELDNAFEEAVATGIKLLLETDAAVIAVKSNNEITVIPDVNSSLDLLYLNVFYAT